MRKTFLTLLVVYCSSLAVLAQGRFSGDLQLNTKVFDRDTAITPNTDFYKWSYTGLESWLNLNYVHESNLEMGIRFDFFGNSDLFSGGQRINNGVGIGAFYVRKQIDKLNIQIGHIYDQIGGGFIYRGFENRGLGLDNPLVGLRLKYDLHENLSLKAFGGKQKSIQGFVGDQEIKNFFEVYEPFIKGVNLDGNFVLGENGLRWNPGYGFVNRTIDAESMNQVVNGINSQAIETRFVPRYNTYAHTFYNNFSFKSFNLLTEYSWKSRDVMRELEGDLNLFEDTGQILFGSLGWSKKGFGITASYRDVQNFDFRTSPNQTFFEGIVNFLPPMARQNSLRLPARYQPNAQSLDETGYQLDVIYSPKKGLVFSANASYIENDNEKLFSEYYLDCEIKKKGKKWKLLTGLNIIDWNQLIFQGPGKSKWVNTITPFAEYTYKITRRKSIRTEFQYLLTKRDNVLLGKEDPDPTKLQDLGDWVYGLIEFNIAPKYSFSVSDMYSIDSEVHYYDISAFYTKGANRFSVGYVRQVEGIVCTGGVCRFEPAFNGLKMSLTSSF